MEETLTVDGSNGLDGGETLACLSGILSSILIRILKRNPLPDPDGRGEPNAEFNLHTSLRSTQFQDL